MVDNLFRKREAQSKTPPPAPPTAAPSGTGEGGPRQD
jgi:hypothetical protein